MINYTDDLRWDETPFIAIDTETTGFSRDDRICEIALVVTRGDRVLEVFHSLVNPGRPIDPGAQAVHGISDEDVAGAPRFEDIKPQVLRLLMTEMPWVAHQMMFDARMLSYVIPREEWPHGIYTLCTLDFSKNHHLSLKLHAKHKLLDLASYLGINYDPDAAHNARNDAELLAKIVPALMGNRPIRQYYTKLSEQWLK